MVIKENKESTLQKKLQQYINFIKNSSNRDFVNLLYDYYGEYKVLSFVEKHLRKVGGTVYTDETCDYIARCLKKGDELYDVLFNSEFRWEWESKDYPDYNHDEWLDVSNEAEDIYFDSVDFYGVAFELVKDYAEKYHNSYYFTDEEGWGSWCIGTRAKDVMDISWK